MDNRRIILYVALAVVVYFLVNAWQKDYPPSNLKPSSPVTTEVNTEGSILPNLPSSETQVNQPLPKSTAAEKQAEESHPTKLITVKTDVLSLVIDSQQGNIVGAQLLAYPVSADEPDRPMPLLYSQADKRFVANSSLFTNINNAIQTSPIKFTSMATAYQLAEGEKQLKVTLEGKSADGLQVKKTFTLSRGSYLIRLDYDIDNTKDTAWTGYMNTQLLRTEPEDTGSSLFQVGSYTGASYSEPGKHRYQKVSFKDMSKANLNTETTGGWIAMQQHYFLSAWVPEATAKSVFYTRKVDGNFTIGSVSQGLTINPGKSVQIGSNLYLGPETTAVLKTISPGLDLTVDYGWLWFLSGALFTLLKAVHSLVGNWGWSIVIVTILIKLVFYRLSATSYKSMANMRKLQPKLQALRDRYGDDKAKISQATMELYRQEKVNPLGGCLPILIQIPVFIALYWVLIESVELRQAPFIFWIKDLAAADPYHILPIIMGGTMLVQQRLNPTPPDPMQAKVMMFLPVLFTALFWNFPAGLVLYWIVNNTLSILQQWHISRKYNDTPATPIAANK